MKRPFQDLPLPARAGVAAFAMTGALTLAYSLAAEDGAFGGRLPLLLAGAAATARVKIPLSRNASISALTCVVLLALMMMGPGSGALVAICGVTVQMLSPGRKPLAHQLIFNTGMISIAVFLSWLAYSAFWSGTGAIYAQSIAMAAATFVYYAANSASVAIIVALATKRPAFGIWRAQFAHTSVSFMVSGLISDGIYLAIR